MTHLAVVIAVFVVPLQAAAGHYGIEARRADIAATLDALREADLDRISALGSDVYAATRTGCRAAFGTPTVGCVIARARDRCAREPAAERDRCARIADVVATNLLSEKFWVDNRARLAVMNAGGDFRTGMTRELRRRYALLAADYAISADYRRERPDIGIDAFCARVGAARDIPWQRCVAAIAWFMGTER